MSDEQEATPTRREALFRMLRTTAYIAPIVGVMSLKNVAVAQASGPGGMGMMGMGGMMGGGMMGGGMMGGGAP